MSINERMGKENVEMFTTECDSTLKKKEILLFVTTWMNLENNTPNEAKETQILRDLPCEKREWGSGEKRGCGQKAQSRSHAR